MLAALVALTIAAPGLSPGVRHVADPAGRAPRIPRVLVWFPSRFTPAHARQQVRAVIQRTPLTAIHIDTVQAALLIPGAEAEHDVLARRVVRFVRAAVDEARRSCVRVGLDFDWDRALPAYEKAHPKETFSRLEETDLTLDDQGRATATVSGPKALRRLASDFPAVRSDVHRVFAYDSGKQLPATATSSAPNTVTVSIDGGASHAGEKVLVLTRHEYRHPDLFGRGLARFQARVLRMYRGTGVGLADLDELGLPNEPQNFQDIISGEALKNLWRTPWYSPGLKKRYERSTGRNYERDLLAQRKGDIRAVSAYYDVLREGIAGLERSFYKGAKRSLGRDVFVGVHPTWYGLYPSVVQYEFQRNGMHWWEVPRDVAQLDEGVVTPVKLAIGRRWHSPITTTMVYSPTFETFLDAAYAEARYNGRVDYDGSAGTDGPDSLGAIITNVMTGTRPEQLAAVEERTTLLDDAARSLPRPSALVVFGYYSGAAWMSSNPDGDAWDLVEPHGNTTNSAMEIARTLTDQGYTVDLVPSTEVDAGRVAVDASGRATYGGHAYPAAALAYPEFSRSATLDWAGRVKHLGLIGEQTTDAEGHDVSARFAALRDRAAVALPGTPVATTPVFFQATQYGLPLANPAAGVVATQLASGLGLQKDPIEDGSLLDDGTVIITKNTRYEPDAPALQATTGGHTISAVGGDFFAARLDAAGRLDRVAGDKLQSVTVDGKQVLHFDRPYDLAVRRTGETWSLTYRGATPTDPFLRSIADRRSLAAARCTVAPDTRAPRVRLRPGRTVRWTARGGAVAFEVTVGRKRRYVIGRRRLPVRHGRVRIVAYDLAGNRSRPSLRRY